MKREEFQIICLITMKYIKKKYGHSAALIDITRVSRHLEGTMEKEKHKKTKSK